MTEGQLVLGLTLLGWAAIIVATSAHRIPQRHLRLHRKTTMRTSKDDLVDRGNELAMFRFAWLATADWVVVLERRGDRALIDYRDGTTGWVDASELMPYDEKRVTRAG